MPEPVAALVDLDGTLVDNTYLHAVAWWRACRDMGEDIPMARLHRLIGMGSDHLIDHLFHREWQELSDAHSRHYRPDLPEVRPFPNAAALLREMASRGVRTVLASSSNEHDLRVLREHLDADDALDEVVTADDVGASKPSPDIFSVALRKAGVEPARAVAIGDTRWDIEAAGRCAVPCITVLTGGWSAAELEAAGAAACYSDVGELLRQLDSSPLAPLLS